MNIEKETFEVWMERLLDKLEAMDTKLNSIHKQKNILDGDILLDNQDLCQLLKVSNRTLQRYRTKRLLPYYSIDGKVYYKSSDLHEFIRKHV